MAPRKAKCVPKLEEGTSKTTKRKDKKSEVEHMKSIIDAYMARNPPEIKEQIVG